MGERVLVLGGTGSVGPPLCRALLARGYEVQAFNRGSRLERLPVGVEHLPGDRRAVSGLDELRRVTAHTVIDTAGWYPETLPAILEILAPRIKRYLFISSIAVYPGASALPLDEDATTGANRAWGPIGETKIRCESACRRAAALGLPVTILRPAHLLGGDPATSREAQLAALLASGRPITLPGDGEARLQFTGVADLTAICLEISDDNRQAVSSSYNVCAQDIWTIREWVTFLAGRLGITPRLDLQVFDWRRRHRFLYWPGDVVASGRRLRRELGVSPRPALAFLPTEFRHEKGVAQLFAHQS